MKAFDKRKVPGLEDCSSESESEEEIPFKRLCNNDDIEIELEVQDNEFLKEEPLKEIRDNQKKFNNVWGDVIQESILDESFNKVGVNKLTVQRSIESYCINEEHYTSTRKRNRTSNGHNHSKSKDFNIDDKMEIIDITGSHESNERHTSIDRHKSKERHRSRNGYKSTDKHRIRNVHKSKDKHSDIDIHKSTDRHISLDRHKSKDRHKSCYRHKSKDKHASRERHKSKDRIKQNGGDDRYKGIDIKDRIGTKNIKDRIDLSIDSDKPKTGNIKDRIESKIINNITETGVCSITKDRNYIPINPEIDSKQHIVFEIARILQEPKIELIETCMNVLGKEKCLEFFYMTEDIEENGGLMVVNGSRRRTAGGVFLTLIKESKTVDEASKRLIFPFDFAYRQRSIAGRFGPTRLYGPIKHRNGNRQRMDFKTIVVARAPIQSPSTNLIDLSTKSEKINNDEELEEGEII